MYHTKSRNVLFFFVAISLCFLLIIVIHSARIDNNKDTNSIAPRELCADIVRVTERQISQMIDAHYSAEKFLPTEHIDTYNDISILKSENENQNSILEIENQKSKSEIEISNLNFENAFTNCSAKTYADWHCITDTKSRQWELLHHSNIQICADGMLRDNEGYICAALGSYFGEVGSRWIFFLENGNQIPVVKCDEKADVHTLDTQHTIGVNQDIIEFYIDVSTHSTLGNVKDNGFVYWGNFNNCNEYVGNVIGWVRVGVFEF